MKGTQRFRCRSCGSRCSMTQFAPGSGLRCCKCVAGVPTPKERGVVENTKVDKMDSLRSTRKRTLDSLSAQWEPEEEVRLTHLGDAILKLWNRSADYIKTHDRILGEEACKRFCAYGIQKYKKKEVGVVEDILIKDYFVEEVEIVEPLAVNIQNQDEYKR